MSGSAAPAYTDADFDQAGSLYNVDPNILRAVQSVENTPGDPNAVSPKGAVGLMQLMPATAKSVGVTDPTDPKQSIFGAAAYLRKMLDKSGGDVPTALGYYNAGPNGDLTNPQTAAYVPKVAKAYQVAQAKSNTATDATEAPVDDGFDAAWGVGKATPPPAAASAPTPTIPTDDGFDRAWGVGQPAAASPSAAAAPPTAQPQGLAGNFGAGVMRGLTDVRDTATNAINYVDSRVPFMASIDGAIGRPLAQGQALAGQEAQARADYNSQYGGSIPAAIGRAGGNMLATAPVLGGVGGMAADAVGAGAEAAGVAGNVLARGAGYIGSGAAQGATANVLSSGGTGQSPLAAAQQGAEFGAAGGALAPLANKFGGAVGNMLSGGTVDPARAALASRAKDLGITLTAPQISDNPNFKFLASGAQLMGGQSGITPDTQMGQFTRAVSRSFGENAPALTQNVMSNAQTRLGSEFNRIAAATNITTDPQFHADLGTIGNDAASVLTPQEMTPLENQIKNVTAAVDPNGDISGAAYQSLTRKGAPLDRAMSSDNPNVSYYAGQIRDALDDTMARSLTSSGQTDLLNDLQATRFAYKNLKTVEPLVNKAPDGMISPTLLQGRVNAQFPNRATQGAGDLGDLADIGQSFFKGPPSSGTAERNFMIQKLGTAGGAAAAFAIGNPNEGLAAGGLLASQLIGGKLAGSYMNSGMAANALLARSTGQPTLLGSAGNALATPLNAYGAAVPALGRVRQNYLAP